MGGVVFSNGFVWVVDEFIFLDLWWIVDGFVTDSDGFVVVNWGQSQAMKENSVFRFVFLSSLIWVGVLVFIMFFSSFFFFLIRFRWGSFLRWVCVGSGWVYCFGFMVDSWWFCGRFCWILWLWFEGSHGSRKKILCLGLCSWVLWSGLEFLFSSCSSQVCF